MARHTGPTCKLCRREGEKLFLKGDRCFSQKCAMERRSYPPGQHGRQAQFRRKESDFALQLRAKQRVKRVYGIYERQFRRYFGEAQRMRGLTGVNLLILLESRFDNVIYRLGFAESRKQSRQLVRHGHFKVNGRKIDIPSYLAKTGDIITVHENSTKKPFFKERRELIGERNVPDWLELDADNMTARVLAVPRREHIDADLNEQLVVEFYSR